LTPNDKANPCGRDLRMQRKPDELLSEVSQTWTAASAMCLGKGRPRPKTRVRKGEVELWKKGASQKNGGFPRGGRPRDTARAPGDLKGDVPAKNL